MNNTLPNCDCQSRNDTKLHERQMLLPVSSTSKSSSFTRNTSVGISCRTALGQKTNHLENIRDQGKREMCLVFLLKVLTFHNFLTTLRD